jgi:phosphoribosylamine---glycine ligase
VLVTSSASEAKKFIERLTNGDEFGDAGKRVLLEEGLDGKELSYIILTDGANFISLAPTRDHKRAFDNDEGPNTGGMGTYSTDEMLTRELEEQIVGKIVQPTLAGLRKEGMEYRGFIFFGLMLTKDGPKVLEYNCRLGDPETQAILLRADFDFAAACMDAARGKLDGSSAKWARRASVCVVMASEGYPSNPVLGKPIIGLEQAEKVPNVAVFHAGTRREANNYYTSGGRILAVAAVGDSLQSAHAAAYNAATRIAIPGAHYRKDIGTTDIEKAKIAEVRANG